MLRFIGCLLLIFCFIVIIMAIKSFSNYLNSLNEQRKTTKIIKFMIEKAKDREAKEKLKECMKIIEQCKRS